MVFLSAKRAEKKQICTTIYNWSYQESLCDNLAVETCLECLVLADLHNAEELKNAAVKFVVEHSEDFVDQVLADFSFDCSLIFTTRRRLIFSSFFQVDKFKSYPDLMALLFNAMATRLLVLIEWIELKITERGKFQLERNIGNTQPNKIRISAKQCFRK